MEQKNSSRWQPGVSGNPKGRPKGSKNKFTKDMKEIIMRIVGKHMQHLDKDMTEMSPKDRVQAANAFLKYFISTNSRQKTKVDGKIQIDVKYGDDEPKEEESKED